MSKLENLKWIKNNFGETINSKFKDTLFDPKIAIAIAQQETGYLIAKMRNAGVPTNIILQNCVGDTLDTPNRKAFPINKADLLSQSDGDEMFQTAREALSFIAEYDTAYAKVLKNEKKFCHGYGIFQYDLQFFLTDKEFFINKEWYNFESCLNKMFKEINHVANYIYPNIQDNYTDTQLTYIAIGYNKGARGVKINKNFKQGYKDGEKYYGEHIHDSIQLLNTISDEA